MRGKGTNTNCAERTTGITPAYAGKRRAKARTRTQTQDHPRVCGEKRNRPGHRPARAGSPPRMRGKVTKYVCKPQGVGITPAYAGKRLLPSSGGTRARDHPRVCGEKFPLFPIRLHRSGSPPRMRGKEPVVIRHFRAQRITPAYAGKSLTIQKMTTSSRDHPRVCGEKSISLTLRSSL